MGRLGEELTKREQFDWNLLQSPSDDQLVLRPQYEGAREAHRSRWDTVWAIKWMD